MTGAVDGRSAEASARIRRAPDRKLERVEARCAELPTDVRALWNRTRALTRSDIGLPGVRRLEAAFGEWARAYREDNPMDDSTALVEYCRTLGDSIRVGYELWWEPATYGRRWSMILVFDNDTDRAPLLDLSGHLWATAMIDADRYTPSDGRGHRTDWGGSSSDSVKAPPGRSTKVVALTRRPELGTGADGEVYDVHAEVFLPVKLGYCSLPVPRLN